jgi:hypothetical protein
VPSVDDPPPGNSRFPNTSWGLVPASRDDEGGRDALSTLCRRCWAPTYANVRRHGLAPAAVKVSSAILVLLVGVLMSVASAQSRKAIIAGPIAVSGNTIAGSFKVEETSRGGAEATGSGGACLVFSEHRGGGAACNADNDCALDPPFTGGHAYCLRSGNEKKGRCWLRPAETPSVPYCLRSPVAPLPLNASIEFPVDSSGNLLPVANARAGWWRVHACLNITARGCASPADPGKLISDGPPAKVP